MTAEPQPTPILSAQDLQSMLLFDRTLLGELAHKRSKPISDADWSKTVQDQLKTKLLKAGLSAATQTVAGVSLWVVTPTPAPAPGAVLLGIVIESLTNPGTPVAAAAAAAPTPAPGSLLMAEVATEALGLAAAAVALAPLPIQSQYVLCLADSDTAHDQFGDLTDVIAAAGRSASQTPPINLPNLEAIWGEDIATGLATLVLTVPKLPA